MVIRIGKMNDSSLRARYDPEIWKAPLYSGGKPCMPGRRFHLCFKKARALSYTIYWEIAMHTPNPRQLFYMLPVLICLLFLTSCGGNSIEDLDSRFAFVRKSAVKALGERKEAEAIEPLIGALKDEDYDVRRAAAEALLNIGEPAIRPLFDALKAKNYYVRHAASGVLGDIGWVPLSDEEKAYLLIADKGKPNYSETHPRAYLKELVKIGRPAVLPLIEALGYEFPEALLREPFKPMFDEPANSCREAAWALGMIGDPVAVPFLTESLKKEACAKSSVHALGEIGSPGAIQELAKLINNGDVFYRELSARSLGKISDPRAILPLTSALKDEDSGVRAAAVGSLGKINDPKITQLLVVALKDGDSGVRSVARSRLRDTGWEPSNEAEWLNIIFSDPSDYRWNALVKFGARAVNFLIRALGDKEGSIRGYAASALGEIGDKRAVPHLLNALADENYVVREQAVSALGKLGDTRATQPLIHILENVIHKKREPHTNILVDTVSALGSLGDPLAEQVLTEALKHKSSTVRAAARYALKAVTTPAVVKPSTDTSGSIGDSRAVQPLVEVLPNWRFGPAAAAALNEIGWRPVSRHQEVHYFVATRDNYKLDIIWNSTRKVLLKDMSSNNLPVMENALLAFIGIGRTEIIPELITMLNIKGNEDMAEMYLNSGNKELNDAATAWANNHGYMIFPGQGAHSIGWGSM